MGRAVLLDCLPWVAVLVILVIVLRLMVRLNGARPRWRRLLQLHRDQKGSVQSLSFVLTLPFFIMVMLMILQVSQVMIGQIVVHYAAYSAARSAIVWVPARMDFGPEEENCISVYYIDPEAPDQVLPVFDPTDENYGPAEGGVTYVVVSDGPKYAKIRSAAVLACMAISPSRDLGLEVPPEELRSAEIIKHAYGAMVPDAASNARIPRRLENKLAYATRATSVEVRFFHTNLEPPLVTYWIGGDRLEDWDDFHPDEMGWQDPITVTVTHHMALLPGPGRLLARPTPNPIDGSEDEVAARIQNIDGVYVYPLTASVTLGNEGQKPVLPYVQHP